MGYYSNIYENGRTSSSITVGVTYYSTSNTQYRIPARYLAYGTTKGSYSSNNRNSSAIYYNNYQPFTGSSTVYYTAYNLSSNTRYYFKAGGIDWYDYANSKYQTNGSVTYETSTGPLTWNDTPTNVSASYSNGTVYVSWNQDQGGHASTISGYVYVFKGTEYGTQVGFRSISTSSSNSVNINVGTLSSGKYTVVVFGANDAVKYDNNVTDYNSRLGIWPSNYTTFQVDDETRPSYSTNYCTVDEDSISTTTADIPVHFTVRNTTSKKYTFYPKIAYREDGKTTYKTIVGSPSLTVASGNSTTSDTSGRNPQWTFNLEDLSPGTTYVYTIYLISTWNGDEQTDTIISSQKFTTKKSAPTGTVSAKETDVTTSSASISITFDPSSSSKQYYYRAKIYYSTSDNVSDTKYDGVVTTNVQASSGSSITWPTSAQDTTISGLSENTKYYYRVYIYYGESFDIATSYNNVRTNTLNFTTKKKDSGGGTGGGGTGGGGGGGGDTKTQKIAGTLTVTATLGSDGKSGTVTAVFVGSGENQKEAWTAHATYSDNVSGITEVSWDSGSADLTVGIGDTGSKTWIVDRNNLKYNTTYTFTVTITNKASGAVVASGSASFTTTHAPLKQWSWTAASGSWNESSGSANSYLSEAYAAVNNRGHTRSFDHSVWNDVIYWIIACFTAIDSDFSVSQARMSDSDTVLTAIRYNTVVNAAEDLISKLGSSSYSLSTHGRGENVLGSYITGLISEINSAIDSYNNNMERR